LGEIDRTPDQLAAVDQILRYCGDHAVDVLVVAGDVFNNYRGEAISNIVRELARRLHPHLADNMKVVSVAGNHDRDHFFRLLQTVRSWSFEVHKRIVFAGTPAIETLHNRTDEQPVQFVLAPYPWAHRYLPNDAGVSGLAKAERNQAIARAFASHLAEAKHNVNPSRPSVLVTHALLRGAETSTGYCMSEGEDVPIEPSDLPAWAYVALGHIHRAQTVAGNPLARYSGSPERLDAGESTDEKSCVLFDIDDGGQVHDLTLLPLDATPIYTVEVRSSEDIDSIAARHPDRQRALVNLRVVFTPGLHQPQEMLAALHRVFPRVYDHRIQSSLEAPLAIRVESDRRDLGATVRWYLERQLENHPRREPLLELADDIAKEVNRAAVAS
jgi:exonuclease SbcD